MKIVPYLIQLVIIKNLLDKYEGVVHETNSLYIFN